MARIYASAVFCSQRVDIDRARLRKIARDLRTPEWSRHVERSHRCALGFCFNAFYAKKMRITHLLSARFSPNTALPEVWSDWTLIEDRRLGTATLHISFSFPSLQLDLDNPACAVTEAVAAFLGRVYQLSEREQHLGGGLGELSRVLCAAASRRRNALGISRYINASLICDDPAQLKAPSEPVKVNLYRLLFQHARGVDAGVAVKMLPEGWGSAAFFRLYGQAGGMLSVSEPYPADLREEFSQWFEPTPPFIDKPPFEDDAVSPVYPSYDLLPEYPPLRYLAVPAILYSAAYEETLRQVHEAAFGALAPWLRLPWQRRPAVTHLLAANLEGLRLPVARELVNQMLDKQLQDRTTTAAMEMLRIRETTRNLLISALAIILTILFADYAKVKTNVGQLLTGEQGAQTTTAPSPATPPK